MDETKLIGTIKPYLAKCRAGDWNHALRVVKWVKVLGDGREDLDLLVTAAYIHDIGWFNVAPEGKIALQELLQFEDQANANTSKFVNEVLTKMNFSEQDIKKVIRLISAADKHKSETEDESIIVDADSLSKLCVEHVQEKFTPESYKEITQLWENEFPKRIKTKKGKELYPSLLVDLKNKLL